MDLKKIQEILEANTKDGTLTLPADALESPPIKDAFRDYLLDGDLVIKQVSIVPIGGQNVTAVGQGGSFPFENTYVTATFTTVPAPDGVAAMTIQADGFYQQTKVWNFPTAFPVLASTFYKDLKFNKGVLTLRSSNASLTQPPGLSFAGTQELAGTLAVIGKLLNGSTDVDLSGAIKVEGEKTAAKAVPVMALEDPSPGSAFGMEFIFQLLDDKTVVEKRPPDTGAKTEPVPLMQLVSRITVDAEDGKQSVDIVTHFTPTFGVLTFQADMDDALAVSQAALNALARGANLGSVLPPQLPLVNRFRLGQWSMTVIPQAPQITSISMGAGITEPWAVIPGYFTLREIEFAFTINYVNGKWEPTASLIAKIEILDGPAKFTLVVDAQYPSYIITGFLEEENKVDLIELVRWFLGDTVANSLPCKTLKVSVLTLLLDPRNSTYTFETVIQADCSFNLGIATFTLTQVSFNFSHVAGETTGSFAAAFWIVPPQQHVAKLFIDDPPGGTVAMEVSAAYNGKENGWSFRGGLAPDGKIDLKTLIGLYLPPSYQDFIPDVVITTLEAGFETGASKAYDFAIGAEWTIGIISTKIGAIVKISSALDDKGVRKDEGEVQGFIRFGGDGETGGLELKVTAKFNDTQKVYIFEFLGWTATLSSSATEKTLVFEAGHKSLGEMIEVLINAVAPGADIKLAPPWSVLNSIPLTGFKFTVKFSPVDSSAESASLRYSPNINLGFAKLEDIELEYEVKTKRVMFRVTKGEFLGKAIGPTNKVEWDVAKPETTKPVPGQGSEVFRLEFLGLGQHMAVANQETGALLPVPVNVFQAVKQLNEAFAEKENKTLVFNEATDWLIGTKFTLLQAVDLGIVFYDPELYGLVISVTGAKAAEKFKVFDGLVFEILYKKISDTIGMWQIDLTLPKYIRNLQFGAVSVTLPSMKVQIYTNGDFMIDLGFPANGDFSRSFSIQMLPFVGSGGLYFGVLSSETSGSVPKTSNGSFSPVISFGLGLRVGLGKDLDYGVLKAGMSLTVEGILEGIFAWYNPYPPPALSSGSETDAQLVQAGSRAMVPARNNQLAAASKDNFYYMVQAKVSLVGKLYGSVDLAIISATLDVEVRVSLRLTLQAYRAIDVYFEVNISLTLKVRINLGLFKITINLSFKMKLSFGFKIGNDDPAPPWGRTTLLRQASFMRRLGTGADEECPVIPEMVWQPLLNDSPVKVPLMFVPQFTAATDGPLGVGSPRKPYVVAMTYVHSVPPKATPTAPAPFDEIARGALLWTLNAYLNKDKENTTLQELLTQDISITQLKEIYCYLTQKDLLEPFTEGEVLGFLENFFTFEVTIPPPAPPPASAVVQTDEDNVSIFPIMPRVKLTTTTGIEVDFSLKTPSSPAYLDRIKKYFEEMAVRYKSAAEKKDQPLLLKRSAELGEKSLASFLFMDFFAMLARSTVQDAIDRLQAQQAPLNEGESLADLVRRRPELGIDVEGLARANAARRLRAGVQLRVPGVVYTVKHGDTVESVAAKLDHNVAQLRSANPAMNGQLPPPASQIKLPGVTFTTSRSQPESLLDITRLYGVSLAELALANEDVPELFAANEPLLAPYAERENIDTLTKALQANGSFKNLSGLAARVLLQGLRPPSPEDSPQAGAPAPLYELTGQQIDGSGLVEDSAITLTVSEGTEKWFQLGDGASLTYKFSKETADALASLGNAAFGPLVKFEPAKLLRIEPRRFTLPSSVLWNTPTTFFTANRGDILRADTIEPTLWQFPSELIQVITGPRALQPKVELFTEQQAGPGQDPNKRKINDYTWSTIIEIKVRQTASGDKVYLPNKYELTGVDAGATQLLENLLVWYAQKETVPIQEIRILYPPNPAVEGQTEPPTGLKSDPAPEFFLLQTNLSTASQPPQLTNTTANLLALPAPYHPLGQTDIEFLKLLWESSVVNSGGYVLYYETLAKTGLPDYLFSQDGIATLTLLITYSITDNVLQSFMNNVVINEVIDIDNEVLYASPLPQTVSDFKLASTQSLADVAARYRVSVSQLATQYNNAHAKLATGKHLRIPPLTYRVRDGEQLQTIAARANVTARAVTELNPATANAPQLTNTRFLRLPETVWRSQEGESLASLAERFSTTVVTLAHANKDVPGLIEGSIQFDDQLEQAIPTIPPGNIAFQIVRPGAASRTMFVDPPTQLAELYNLLGYRVKPDDNFRETNSALPISPITPEGSVDWIYESVVPVYPFAKSPADDKDPYNSVGDTVQVNYNWQDLFGNWIDSAFKDQHWPDQGFWIGYIDNLIPLDQWPSITSDYVIASSDQSAGSAGLIVMLRFNSRAYLPAEGIDPAAIQDMALTDLGKFQTIYYQLKQPDVQVTLSSTMQASVDSNEAGSPKEVMAQFLQSIINFLTPISAGLPAPPAPVDTPISQPVTDANPRNLFALVVRLQIARNADLVDGQFKDIPAVTSVSSRVPANAAKDQVAALQSEPVPPLSLQEFARRLETAFPSLKVLVAAPKKSLGETAEEIWIARLAPTSTGIAFKIDGQKPSFFAVAPLARNLLSRPDVLVYQYQSGKYLGSETPIKTSQNSIDLDQMGRDFLAAMEQVLGPQFSSATWKLQYGSGADVPVTDPPDPKTTPYEAIIAAKETLATAISNHAVNVFENVSNDGLLDAREVLRQQLLANLTAAYTVDVIMQYPVEITHSQYSPDDPYAPRLFGKPVSENPDNPDDVDKKDAYSFSTGKFSLAKRATGTHLTFTFETNREQQGAEGKQVDDVFTIDLFHQINALEHQIHRVPGIDGYLASSWLTFVLPDSFDTPGERKILVPLGKQTIPVPLRAYPTPPSLSEQTFIPYVKQFVGDGDLLGANEDKLLQARLWDYRSQYEYVGAAHDKILADVKLNVPSLGLMKAQFNDADSPDLFASLVQFTAAYPGIAKDLDKYLATGTDDAIAFNAISSFAWLAQRTANAWLRWQTERLLHDAQLQDSPEYHFVITQQAEEGSGALVVTVTADGPGLRLPTLPRIDIEGYTTKEKSQTTDSVSYYFVSDKGVLPYNKGRDISTRQLVFRGFDILKIENAWAGAAVKRNEDLLPNKTTNPDFVFQSPVVRFANVLTPLLDPAEEIDIATYTGTSAELSLFLSNFLIAFFAGAQTAGNETRMIRLSAAYSYGLEDSGSGAFTSAESPDLVITIPILLTTPTPISISGQGLAPDSTFVKDVSETINAFFRNNDPKGVDRSGRLWFDLSIYSSLSESQLPVLRMRRLYLESRLIVFG